MEIVEIRSWRLSETVEVAPTQWLRNRPALHRSLKLLENCRLLLGSVVFPSRAVQCSRLSVVSELSPVIETKVPGQRRASGYFPVSRGCYAQIKPRLWLVFLRAGFRKLEYAWILCFCLKSLADSCRQSEVMKYAQKTKAQSRFQFQNYCHHFGLVTLHFRTLHTSSYRIL